MYVDTQAKVFLVLYPPFENSTTPIAIVHTLESSLPSKRTVRLYFPVNCTLVAETFLPYPFPQSNVPNHYHSLFSLK